MYAEINTKDCYCEVCGFDGDIPLIDDNNGKLVWECPNCGNTDNTKWISHLGSVVMLVLQKWWKSRKIWRHS